MNMHFCFGRPETHMIELAKAATSGDCVSWTIDRFAIKDDLAVFYLVRPLSCLVAWGTVKGTPWLLTERRSEWYGHHMARVHKIRLLPRPIERIAMMKMLPEWKFLKAPRRELMIPERFQRQVSKMLGITAQ